MPRPIRILQNEYPYHIVNRVNNKEHLYNLERTYPLFLHFLKKAATRTDFRPHHFILMGNHFHLIGSTPKSNLNEFMHLFQLSVSKSINKMTERENHFFKGRYHASIIADDRYYINVIRYLYQNPVRAKITKDPYSYKYSSLQLYMENSWEKYHFDWGPIFSDMTHDERIQKLEKIIKLFIENDEARHISIGLKKPFFYTTA